ncbi:MAG: hypothetical protein AAGG53_14120, partial [Cyanobacteria bacterium P01_H01_bin.152]
YPATHPRCHSLIRVLDFQADPLIFEGVLSWVAIELGRNLGISTAVLANSQHKKFVNLRYFEILCRTCRKLYPYSAQLLLIFMSVRGYYGYVCNHS